MAESVWRNEYFADIQQIPGGYWPFTEYRPISFASRYVNIDDWVRRSYGPQASERSIPTVWAFGGSALWGEGQRDEYTIASWLARIAEQEGTPIRVRNFGQRGWTHFQGMLLFQQRLLVEPPPDIAVFYDGANEVTTQALLSEAAPSHGWALAYAQLLKGANIRTDLVQVPEASPEPSSLVDAYLAHSVLAKFARALAGKPAGADSTDPAEVVPRGFTPQRQEASGNTVLYSLTDQDGIDAGRVYEQGKRMSQVLAEDRGIRPLFFWQPQLVDGGAFGVARQQLSASTVDLSRALDDHQDVYIDANHTNEVGARIVAERMWEYLGPVVRDWHRSRR